MSMMLSSPGGGTESEGGRRPGRFRRVARGTLIAALLLTIAVAFVVAYVRTEEAWVSNARYAKGVVIEKHFAAAAGGDTLLVYYSDGYGGFYTIPTGGARQDRWLIAVHAVEEAKGTRVIEVPSRVYYRVWAGEVVPLRITRGGLSDPDTYVVEIDEGRLPEPPPAARPSPAAEMFPAERESLTNAKGQIRE
jgi:hypothetical protein